MGRSLAGRTHVDLLTHGRDGRMRSKDSYRNDGSVPHWRAILDDDERVMVMITYNNDIADGWQHADEYYYPHESANLALRMGVNFAVYALTH